MGTMAARDRARQDPRSHPVLRSQYPGRDLDHARDALGSQIAPLPFPWRLALLSRQDLAIVTLHVHPAVQVVARMRVPISITARHHDEELAPSRATNRSPGRRRGTENPPPGCDCTLHAYRRASAVLRRIGMSRPRSALQPGDRLRFQSRLPAGRTQFWNPKSRQPASSRRATSGSFCHVRTGTQPRNGRRPDTSPLV
jgi:hypothetical protein